MGDLFSYSLSDFVVYSAPTLFAMTEDMNRALYPLLILLAVLFAVMAWLGWRKSRHFIPVALFGHALMCCLVAWLYFGDYYASLDWAAVYYSRLFYALTVLLAISALWQWRSRSGLSDFRPSLLLGVVYALTALFILPILGWYDGRSLTETALPGLTPHAIMLSLTGVLLLSDNYLLKMLLLGPLIWGGVTLISSWPLGLLQGQVVLPLVILAIITTIVSRIAYKSHRALRIYRPR